MDKDAGHVELLLVGNCIKCFSELRDESDLKTVERQYMQLYRVEENEFGPEPLGVANTPDILFLPLNLLLFPILYHHFMNI